MSHSKPHKNEDIQIKQEEAFYSKNTTKKKKKIKYIPVIENQIINYIDLITMAKYRNVLCAIPKCTGQINVNIIHNQ